MHSTKIIGCILSKWGACYLIQMQAPHWIDTYQWYIPVESYFIWLCSTAVGSLYEWSPCDCLFFFLLKGLPLPSSTLSDLVIWSLTNSTCCFKNCQKKKRKKVLNIFFVIKYLATGICVLCSVLFLQSFNYQILISRHITFWMFGDVHFCLINHLYWVILLLKYIGLSIQRLKKCWIENTILLTCLKIIKISVVWCHEIGADVSIFHSLSHGIVPLYILLMECKMP